MRRVIIILLLLGLVICLPSGLMAQSKTTVFNSDHNLNWVGGDDDGTGDGCAGCHVPHQASQRGQTLLWNQSFSIIEFGTYSSDTMDSSPAEIGDATFSDSNPPTGVQMFSVLCMSCHDGVTAASIIGPTDAAAVGNIANSSGLTNDHPVNMEWPSPETGLETAVTAEGTGIVLYTDGTFTDTVQCGSCHNPHDPTNSPFLRVANNPIKAGLCGSCHL